MIASQLHLDLPASLFIHSYIYSFIHDCSYWTYGPRSASFTFRALNLWLYHPLANVVSSGGNTAWSMATFSLFYLFFSFTLMCLRVVFIYRSYFIAHAHTASSLSGWAVLPALLFLSGWPFFSLSDQLSHHLFRHCTLLPPIPSFWSSKCAFSFKV